MPNMKTRFIVNRNETKGIKSNPINVWVIYIYIYMYVCMYVCMYAHVYVHYLVLSFLKLINAIANIKSFT